MQRRTFLSSAAALALPLRAQSTAARIDVLVDEPIATIAPEIYGHFVEHPGAVVYDGIWVGEDSKIPNVQGMRKALVDALVLAAPQPTAHNSFAEPRNVEPKAATAAVSSGMLVYTCPPASVTRLTVALG